jgi:hypothetical protein
MISEEDFSVIEGLDPPIAFVRLERRFRNVLERNLENSQNTQAYNSYLYEYVNHVIAAAQALEIAELDGWQIPDNENEMWEYYKRLITQIDRYAVRIQISNIRQPSRGSVGLEPAERQEVRHYVEQIKTVIESSKLDIAKKERLLDRINEFLRELDKERTPVQVLSDVVIELSRTGGQAAQELEPAWKWIKLIAGVFGGRQENERVGLPKPTTPKKLEPPKPKLAAPEQRADMDDEIPF